MVELNEMCVNYRQRHEMKKYSPNINSLDMEWTQICSNGTRTDQRRIQVMVMVIMSKDADSWKTVETKLDDFWHEQSSEKIKYALNSWKLKKQQIGKQLSYQRRKMKNRMKNLIPWEILLPILSID